MMKVKINWLKRLAFVIGGTAMLGAVLIASAPARTTDDDSAALYKSKCAMCHGQTAEKKFDATKADNVLIDIVLKGKTMEKPPNMPAYQEKGITPDQAKGVVAFMKSLKQ
ncbi:MAG: c-type cytochrome [Pyrinomonadaceae bacterium]